jgi:hypothetical protein
MSMSRWNPIYSYLLNLIMTCLELPATAGAVERGGRVTTARRTTTRAAPGCSPRPHTHAGDALRHLTMHISTNNLHCSKPARLLQWAPSGGRPRRRPHAPRSDPPHQQQQTAMEDRWPGANKRPPHNSAVARRHNSSTPARDPPRPPTPHPSPQRPPPPSQSQGQVPITEQNSPSSV